MKVLFCHDGPLRKDEDSNYYGIAHNDELFSRYFNIADKLAVAIRIAEISRKEAEEKFTNITLTPLEIIECPNTATIKGMVLRRNEFKNIISDSVKNADYIVARLPSIVGNAAVDYAKKYKKPYLIELVTCPWDAYWNHSFKGKLIAPFMYLKNKKKVSKATHVIYVTNEFLQSRYPTKGKSVNCSNVVIKKSIKNFITISTINNMKEINSTKLVIGTTAAVNVRFKGQQYIIKALAELKKNGNTSFHYQLVGSGNQKYLKKLAEKYGVEDQVEFLGALPHKKVLDWLTTIDIYAQPSRQEGLPRALIEAMSKGLPSFGANTAGIPELLESKYIFSNTSKNISEICNILLSLNPTDMLKQSERNYLESQKYNKDVIDNRRNIFFEEFKKDSIRCGEIKC